MSTHKFKIKAGDTVKILSGKDKGKTGKVLRVLPRLGKAVVESVNLHTRHEKTKAGGKAGGKVTSPSPLYISKLQVVDPGTGKPSRVGWNTVADKKQRVAKRSGQAI